MARLRVLGCDTIDVAALGLGEAFDVDYTPDVTKDELEAKVEKYDSLVVRSRTKVDAGVTAQASAVGLAGARMVESFGREQHL